MKPIIKRTKQPDIYIEKTDESTMINYSGEFLNLDFMSFIDDKEICAYFHRSKDETTSIWMTIAEAKELAEILPKFLEEMERTK